jgi:hypothetical protein
VIRFRVALPHQLDGPGPTKRDLPRYIDRVNELEAEVERLRIALDAEIREKITRTAQDSLEIQRLRDEVAGQRGLVERAAELFFDAHNEPS